MLVGGEAVLGAGAHEDGATLLERDRLAFDCQDARAFEDDVDLVPFMRLLAVWLRGDED